MISIHKGVLTRSCFFDVFLSGCTFGGDLVVSLGGAVVVVVDVVVVVVRGLFCRRFGTYA